MNKLFFGDCITEMDKIDNNSIDLILTDPPYNASNGGVNLVNNKTGGAYYKVKEKWDTFNDYSSYLEFTENWLLKSDNLLKDGGSSMVCASMHNIGEVTLTLKKMGYKILNVITWKKTNPMPNITKRTLTHSTEFVVWFAKGSGWTFNYEKMKKYNEGKQLRDVWEFALCQGKERIKGDNGRAAHPTQKPKALFQRLIEMASNEGDIILDPFIGSGTTAITALDLNRQYIGIESNKDYYNLASSRIKDFEGELKLCA